MGVSSFVLCNVSGQLPMILLTKLGVELETKDIGFFLCKHPATMHNNQLQLNKEAVGWVVEDEDWGLKCRSRRTNADTSGKPRMGWSRAQASNISTLKEGPSHESTLSPRESCTVVVPSLLFCTHLSITLSNPLQQETQTPNVQHYA